MKVNKQRNKDRSRKPNKCCLKGDKQRNKCRMKVDKLTKTQTEKTNVGTKRQTKERKHKKTDVEANTKTGKQ